LSGTCPGSRCSEKDKHDLSMEVRKRAPLAIEVGELEAAGPRRARDVDRVEMRRRARRTERRVRGKGARPEGCGARGP